MGHEQVSRRMGVLTHWSPFVAPRMLAFSVLLSGAILLFSGATPALHERLQLLRWLAPLSAATAPPFLASVGGLFFLILARGLQRRIDSAFFLTALVLAVRVAFSLLMVLEFEEGLALAAMLVILVTCRRHFYRKGALFAERFTLQWTLAVALLAACSIWLIWFAYCYVDYRDDLWWRFAFDHDAPRSRYDPSWV